MSVELSQTEQQKLMEQINGAVGIKPYREGQFAVDCDDLPFYAKASLVKITNFAAAPTVAKSYIYSNDKVFQTDGSPESVDDINSEIGLTLTQKNVVDYVSFFFNQVISEEGRFYLVSRIEDMPNYKSFGDGLVANLKGIITSPAVNVEEDGFVLYGYVLYGTTLYKTAVIVSSSGEVDVDDDEAVYENLPVQQPKRR